MKKISLDFVQYFSSLLGAIFGGVAGLLIGVVATAYMSIRIGYLPGYEAGGALGIFAGVWIGSLLGLLLAAKLSHVEGSFLWSTIFSLLGSAIMLVGMSWMIPGLNSPFLVPLVAALAYVGWNLPNWWRGRA